jgi:hypothetical protein
MGTAGERSAQRKKLLLQHIARKLLHAEVMDSEEFYRLLREDKKAG